MRKHLLILLFLPVFVWAFGTATVKQIDEIQTNTESTFTITTPTGDVVLDPQSSGLDGYVLTHDGTNYKERIPWANQFFNGAVVETIATTVTSNGATITFTVEKDGTGDLTFLKDGVEETLDCTPITTYCTITLTAGTDTAPVKNYIYVVDNAGTLEVESNTSSFPESEWHGHIAVVDVQTAGTVQTDGPLALHNWTDHLQENGVIDQGHLAHINQKLRSKYADYFSGVAQTTTIVGGSDPDDVYFAVSSGIIFQMHKHAFPALNMQTGDKIWVVNDNTTPYNTTTNLNTELTDSEGITMTNRSFSFVIWGIASEGGSGYSRLMLNLPECSYVSFSSAITDSQGCSIYNIPNQFKSVGFLISRITLSHSSAASGTWTLRDEEDLRGLTPPTAAGGGGGGGGTEFSDSLFKVFNNADNTKEILFDASSITTGTARTYIYPNASGTLALASGLTGGQTIYGGTAASETLTLVSTSDATKSNVIIGDANGLVYHEPEGAVTIGGGENAHTINGAAIGTVLEIHSEGATNPAGLTIHNHGDSGALGAEMTMVRSRGTHASPASVIDNTIIGRWTGLPYDGTDHNIGAQITMRIAGTPGTDDSPTEIAFATTPDGANIPTQRMTIMPDGKVGINDLAPSYQLDVEGLISGNIATTKGKKYRNFMSTGEAQYASITDISTGQNATFDGGGSISGAIAIITSGLIDTSDSHNFEYDGNATSSVADDYWYHTSLQPDEDTFIGLKFHYSYTGTSAVDGDVAVNVKCTTSGTIIYTEDLLQKTSAIFADGVYVPSGCGTLKVGFHVITGRTGGKVLWNRVITTDDPYVDAEIPIDQSIVHSADGSTLTDRNAELEFNTSNLTSSGSLILETVDDSGNTRTKFIALQPCIVTVGFSARLDTANRQVGFTKNGTVVIAGTQISAISHTGGAAGSVKLAVGDYITISTIVSGESVDTGSNVDNTAFAALLLITAEAVSEHVVTPLNTPRQETLTVTGTNWTTQRAVGTYYKGQDGAHRLKFNIVGTLSVGASTPAIAITGVTFKTGADQAVNGISDTGGSYTLLCRTLSGTSTINLSLNTTATDLIYSGDVELDSKPTWADEVNSQYMGYIPIPEIIYIDVHASTYTADTSATTAYKTTPLVSLTGGTFGSISSNQLTLSRGTYDFTVPVAGYTGTSWINSLIYSITDTVNLYEAVGVSFSNSTASTISLVDVTSTLTLSKTTVIEFRTKSTVATGSEYQGRIKIIKRN